MSTPDITPTKQCYTCYEKYNDTACPKCFSTMHWDLTKCEGRNASGIYVTGNIPKVGGSNNAT